MLFILISLIFIQSITRVFNSFIDFDEGYFLVVAQNLHDQLSYASNSQLFDPLISTGPTVLLPAALLINSTNPLLPRLIILIFSMSIIFLAQTQVFSTFRQKIVYLILILITPLYFFFSSHLLGEIPAFAFILASLVLYQKGKYFTSGLLFGLSILTKNVYLFGIFALIFLYLNSKTKASLKQILKLSLSGATIPILMWELFRLASFSFNFNSYFNSLFNFGGYVSQMTGTPYLSTIVNRISMFEYVFFINGYLLLLIVTFVFTLTIYHLTKKSPLVAALAFFGLIYLLYFIFIGMLAYYRHFMLVVLSFTIIFPVFLDYYLKKVKREGILLAIIFLGVIFTNIYSNLVSGNFKNFHNLRLTQQGFIFFNDSFLPVMKPDPLLTAQFKTAEFIRQNIPEDKTLTGIGWWNAPEIAYLSGRKIEQDPFKLTDPYLVTDIYAEIFGYSTLKPILDLPNKKIFETEGKYAIYKLTY